VIPVHSSKGLPHPLTIVRQAAVDSRAEAECKETWQKCMVIDLKSGLPWRQDHLGRRLYREMLRIENQSPMMIGNTAILIYQSHIATESIPEKP
jgi:hypothetical protein